MKKITLSIEGMTCSACSNGLEKYLNKQEAISNATVNLVMASATINYNEKLININDLDRFVSEAGFKSLGPINMNLEEQKISKIPFIVYGILALIIMYISMSHMFNYYVPYFLNLDKYPKNYSLFLLILTIPFLIYGKDIIKNGFKNLIHKIPNMDSLVGIGVVCSFLYSLFGVIMVLLGNNEHIHNLYFESTCFVIYFIKLGRFIDKNAHQKTKEAIKGLVTVTPKKAKIQTENGIKEITIDEIKKGDILICLPGDKFAVDGVITSGSTHTDESFITGESKPVNKSVNDKVIAGSINYENSVLYKAEKIGKESTISEIVNLVIEMSNTKAPISLLADKISGYFVPTIICLASITFIVCLIYGLPFNESLTRFVTVLVVACPCALGLATPLAIVIAAGNSAKSGILIKSSESLEMASKIDSIIFDKTGTLTNGRLSISKLYNYSSLSNNDLLKLLGNIEKYSSHPIAKSIIKECEDKKINLNQEFEIKSIDGFGLKAINNKSTYYVGNSKLLKKFKIKNDYISDEDDLVSNGNTIIYIVKDNTILGLVGLTDTVRSNAKNVIKKLKEMNIEVIMLTGDNEQTASKVAKELNITNIHANVLPKDKANIIRNLKNENKKVMMIGDGINDAPSLAIATIGVTITSATDIASNSSDVILMNDDLTKVIDLINISKRTIKNIKENLFWAFIYNFCMIPIAMGLFKSFNITINPMIACISMIFSSLFVVFNALRLKSKRLH